MAGIVLTRYSPVSLPSRQRLRDGGACGRGDSPVEKAEGRWSPGGEVWRGLGPGVGRAAGCGEDRARCAIESRRGWISGTAVWYEVCGRSDGRMTGVVGGGHVQIDGARRTCVQSAVTEAEGLGHAAASFES